MKITARIIVICSALTLAPHATAGDGPKCIGKICLDQKLVPLKRVSQLYGHTKAGFGVDPAYLCYRAGNSAFLRVGYMEFDNALFVTDVLLSKNEPCPPSQKPAMITARLTTEAGIGLGSSRKEVQARYGEPTRVVRGAPIYHRWLGSSSGIYYDPQPVDDLWQYWPPSDDNSIRGFAFVEDKVVSILVQVY